MDLREFDNLLHDAEVKLKRLKGLYEQWFQGIERIEPLVARKDLDRLFAILSKDKPRNTAARFRLQQLVARYAIYATHWGRIARQIEEGTYERDVRRARQKAERTRGARNDNAYEIELEEEIDLAELEHELDLSGEDPPEPLVRRDTSLHSAPLGAQDDTPTEPPPPAPPPRPMLSAFSPLALGAPKLDGALAPSMTFRKPNAATFGKPGEPPKPAAQAKPAAVSQPGSTAAISASPENPAAKPANAPTPLARELPLPLAGNGGEGAHPRPSDPSAGPPPNPLPQAGNLERSSAGPPLAQAGGGAHGASLPLNAPRLPPAVRVPSPAAVRVPPPSGKTPPTATGSDDGHMRRLYDAYVAARRKNSETDSVAYEKIAEGVRKMRSQLREKHGDKKIDFEVVVQNGKVGFKPKIE